MHPLQFRAAAGSEDAAALIAVHDACREADGVRDDLCYEYLPRLEHYRQKLADTDPADWIVVQSGAEVIGYGQALESWGEQNGRQVYLHLGWVVPSARGKGIGRELLSRLEARCREKRAQDGMADEAEYAANASGTEESAQRLLRAAGYSTVYTAIEMRFESAQPVSLSPLPPGLTLRPVLPEHQGVSALAQTHELSVLPMPVPNAEEGQR